MILLVGHSVRYHSEEVSGLFDLPDNYFFNVCTSFSDINICDSNHKILYLFKQPRLWLMYILTHESEYTA